MVWACSATKETRSLIFINDGNVYKSRRINSEVFMAILSALRQSNLSKLIGWCSIIQNDKGKEVDSTMTMTINRVYHLSFAC